MAYEDDYAGLGPAGEALLDLGAQDMPVGTDEVREAMDAYRAEVLRKAAQKLRQQCNEGHDQIKCVPCFIYGYAADMVMAP